MARRQFFVLAVVLAAAAPYLPTLNDYFVQDDFGVVWLLSSKPAAYFPHWFISSWMDTIWGEPPDEIRPFPAVTYQLAALWGAGSPIANHAINIAFHAVNALLVLRLAETAARLSPGSAAFAAIVFAVLPMQSESVAWVTGRVDSMPACFYLASFLLYVRWRAGSRSSLYIWSAAVYFVALFTKQNTVTLPAAIVLYDVIVAKRPVRVTWSWLRPYVPFVLLTLGYLALRYALFGEVAREGRLSAEYVDIFLRDLSTHLRRMVFGEAGLQLSGVSATIRVAIAAAIIIGIGVLTGDRARDEIVRPAVYFLLIWVALGVAPTVVAGYGSPRHMYLASVGWALSLAAGLEIVWHARPHRVMRALGAVLAALVLVGYGLQLREEIRLWGVRSAVSRRIVLDVEKETASAPSGTLILVDPPQRSWNFALPYALRPPFTGDDLTTRVAVISHSSIHCCPAYLWEEYTRRTMRAWLAHPARPPFIALRWDQETGQLFRLRNDEDPFLRSVVSILVESPDVASLDRLILQVSKGMVVR